MYERALALKEKAYGSAHPDVAAGLNNLATLFVLQEKYNEAEPLFKRALAMVEETLGPNHPSTAKTLYHLADLYSRQGKYAEAEPLLKRAVTIAESTAGFDQQELAAYREKHDEVSRKMTEKRAESVPVKKVTGEPAPPGNAHTTNVRKDSAPPGNPQPESVKKELAP
jgi:tetratricopeptide (TPR) repeat protein